MEKSILFTDIHFGNKGNSVTFNKDCLDFIDFVIETAKAEGITKCKFLGDYFHVRSSINVNTMKYAIEGIRKLDEYFDEVVMILGNHDLYYRENKDVHSLEFAKEFKSVKLIDTITVDGDCAYIPWLNGEEWKNVIGITAPYVFGHFELPGFLLNSMVSMPETGEIGADTFSDQNLYIFSGHFHKRQKQVNKKGYEIHYIGSAFAHNFSDANDQERGVCIVEDGEEPRYINWKEAPNYLNIPLSEILENPEKYINEKTYAKVKLDLNVSYEESIFIRETFMKLFEAREISYVHEKKDIEEYEDIGEITFDTVDAIVVKSLDTVESKTIDKRKLISIYNDL